MTLVFFAGYVGYVLQKCSRFHQPGLASTAHLLAGPTRLYSVSSVQQDLHSYLTEYYEHDMKQHELHTNILKHSYLTEYYEHDMKQHELHTDILKYWFIMNYDTWIFILSDNNFLCKKNAFGGDVGWDNHVNGVGVLFTVFNAALCEQSSFFCNSNQCPHAP